MDKQAEGLLSVSMELLGLVVLKVALFGAIFYTLFGYLNWFFNITPLTTPKSLLAGVFLAAVQLGYSMVKDLW